MIKRVSCVEIPVSEMEKSTAFYENMLGLKKTYEHPVWTSFNVGGVSFALAASRTRKPEKHGKVCTSCSLCVLRYVAHGREEDKLRPTPTSVLYLEVENLNQTYKKLKEEGVKFITKPQEQGWGGRTAVMLDPDNNILVLSEA